MALGKQSCLSNSPAQKCHAGTAAFVSQLLPVSDSCSTSGVPTAGQSSLLSRSSVCQPAGHAVLKASEGAQQMGQNTVQTVTFLEMQSPVCSQNWGGGCKEIN